MSTSSRILVAALAAATSAWVVAPAAAAPIASPMMLQRAVDPSVPCPGPKSETYTVLLVYSDSSIVRKTACHWAILGFVMVHDLRRLFVSR